MLDQLRHDIQTRLDELLSEAEKLRHALAALSSRDGATAPETDGSSSTSPARRRTRPAPASATARRKPARSRKTATSQSTTGWRFSEATGFAGDNARERREQCTSSHRSGRHEGRRPSGSCPRQSDDRRRSRQRHRARTCDREHDTLEPQQGRRAHKSSSWLRHRRPDQHRISSPRRYRRRGRATGHVEQTPDRSSSGSRGSAGVTAPSLETPPDSRSRRLGDPPVPPEGTTEATLAPEARAGISDRRQRRACLHRKPHVSHIRARRSVLGDSERPDIRPRRARLSHNDRADGGRRQGKGASTQLNEMMLWMNSLDGDDREHRRQPCRDRSPGGAGVARAE